MIDPVFEVFNLLKWWCMQPSTLVSVLMNLEYLAVTRRKYWVRHGAIISPQIGRLHLLVQWSLCSVIDGASAMIVKHVTVLKSCSAMSATPFLCGYTINILLNCQLRRPIWLLCMHHVDNWFYNYNILNLICLILQVPVFLLTNLEYYCCLPVSRKTGLKRWKSWSHTSLVSSALLRWVAWTSCLI